MNEKLMLADVFDCSFFQLKISTIDVVVCSFNQGL